MIYLLHMYRAFQGWCFALLMRKLLRTSGAFASEFESNLLLVCASRSRFPLRAP